eukprot:5620574-Pyramimonas_sp.AAC.1
MGKRTFLSPTTFSSSRRRRRSTSPPGARREDSRDFQEAPKTAQQAAKTAQEAPKKAQNGLKRGPRGRAGTENRSLPPKDSPRRPQEASNGTPKRAQDAGCYSCVERAGG